MTCLGPSTVAICELLGPLFPLRSLLGLLLINSDFWLDLRSQVSYLKGLEGSIYSHLDWMLSF